MYKYKKIYSDYKKAIADGIYKKLELLPTEVSIAEHYSVDRSTVRKALQMLSDEGLIEKKAGKGTTVIGPDPLNGKKKRLQASNKSVGFLLPPGNSITEMFYSTLFCVLEHELQKRGCSLIYSTLKPEDDIIKIVSTLGLDAIVFVSNTEQEHIEIAISSGIPCVLLNNYSPLLPSILSDNETGAYLAGRHLIECGHTDILVLSGIQEYTSNKERLQGFKKAMEEAGIELPADNMLVSQSWELEAGSHCIKEYCKTHELRATAIFGLNDRLAFGAMQALHQLGVVVPRDMSVMGFDNLNNMRVSVLRMTTIEAHIEMMAEGAATQILWQIEGGNLLPMRTNSPVELIVGETVHRNS